MVIQLNIKDGKVIGGRDRLEKLIANSINGIHSVRFSYSGRPKNIQECRNYYFFMCDTIAAESSSGYTSKELHNVFKQNVLRSMPLHEYIKGALTDYISFSTVGSPPSINFTTKMLNLEGWFVYIDAVKNYAKEHLDFIL